MSKLPIVAIVGRANVGKSSIFNRVMNQRRAIVAREAGTTRDAVVGRVETEAGMFTLLDTAGLKTAEDQFEASIQEQIIEASAGADLLLVVVDATTDLTLQDRAVAKLAHKSGKPLILVVNKTEGVAYNDPLADFYKLGIKTMIRVSAVHNQGFDDLLQAITTHVKPKAVKDSSEMTLALVGRPNAGKSSLFNSLAVGRQAIVSETAGTTRDVNRTELKYEGRVFTVLDTAGIRRSGKIQKGIEKFSVNRALAAIAEADIVFLVIDANEPGVALEQKLAGEIKAAGKGLILTVTKWDLVDKDAFTHDQLMAKLRSEFQHVPWAMFSVTSATSKQNLGRLLDLALAIKQQREKQVKTSQLNTWLSKAVAHQPPAGFKRIQPKLKYAVQTGNNPPEITIFGRGSRVLHWSYKRYLERTLREAFDFAGTPITIVLKDEHDKDLNKVS